MDETSTNENSQSAEAKTETQTETKAKKPTGLIITTVVASVIALASVATTAVLLIKEDRKSAEISELSAQIESLQNNTNTDNNTEQSTNQAVLSNSYELFLNNYNKNNTFRGATGEYYIYENGTNIEQHVTARIDEKNHLVIEGPYSDGAATIIAEADDIVDAFFVEIGNGGVPYFYLTETNGNLSRICIATYCSNSREIEKIDDFSNIVYVTEGGDFKAQLVDINGNVFEHY